MRKNIYFSHISVPCETGIYMRNKEKNVCENKAKKRVRVRVRVNVNVNVNVNVKVNVNACT